MLPTVHWQPGTSRRVAFVVALLSAMWLAVGAEQVALAQTAPAPTTSRYMTTVDGTTLYNEGCQQGQAAEDGIVILDFGAPWVQNGTYGTILFDARGTFASTAQIEFAGEQFLSGYWDCAPSDTFLRLGLGTSNYRGSTSAEHGQAWASMVDTLNGWINSPPSYAAQEDAHGAIDLEMGWNTAGASRAWVDGYAAVSGTPYYNFGDCEGCPSAGAVLPMPGRTLNNGWTQEDVWYVSYGVQVAFPFPEIYLTNGVNAAQWQQLSLYAQTNHDSPMYFMGVLTQFQSCQSGRCPGTNNRPDDGWAQLNGALNSDSRTAQTLNWSSDITWIN
jgi:hypothetical protein